MHILCFYDTACFYWNSAKQKYQKIKINQIQKSTEKLINFCLGLQLLAYPNIQIAQIPQKRIDLLRK